MSTFATYYLPAQSADAATSRSALSLAISDVRIYHTVDGGEIDFVNGEPVMSDGLESTVYLSLFGGNADDSGLPGDVNKQWWGNFGELVPARQLRSETQYLLATLPPTTGNLRRLESAVKNDCASLISSGYCSAISALATMPARNRVDIAVALTVTPDQSPQRFNFPRSWGA